MRWTRSVGLASALQKQPPYSFVHRIPRGATIPRDRLEREGHSDPITENLLDRLDNLRKFVGNLARSPNDAPETSADLTSKVPVNLTTVDDLSEHLPG